MINRLSWDTTAPRKPTKRRPREEPVDMGLLEAEAELIRVAWDKRRRLMSY
ncbi:MAG TPA: hypothetical protein VFA05_08075 [Gaiellaceae bacterium]|nr:hypothetical protein [Gaiellaceae bacterium]